MNKLLLGVLFILAQTVQGQAHLGITEYAIRNLYPEKAWKVSYTTAENTKFIYTDMVYGTFYYYFDNETKLSNFCMQVPFNIPTMNGQVEAYNKKYVITSDTSWTAYLEDGGIMYIKLVYERESKVSVFTYSSTK